jgi:hypothetical protein
MMPSPQHEGLRQRGRSSRSLRWRLRDRQRCPRHRALRSQCLRTRPTLVLPYCNIRVVLSPAYVAGSRIDGQAIDLPRVDSTLLGKRKASVLVSVLSAMRFQRIWKTTAQAATLNVTSSILAQLLTAYRTASFPSARSRLNPLGLDLAQIFQFLVFCLAITPPNILWQEFLERRFPGHETPGTPKLKAGDDGEVESIREHGPIRCPHIN